MTNRRTGLGPLLVLLAIASLLVSACSAAPGGQGTTTGTAAGQADPNGSITLNMSSEPDTIDPQLSSFVGEIGQASFVFERLMTFDSKDDKPSGDRQRRSRRSG